MYFPILIRIHGKWSAVAVDIQDNRYMLYKCHCLLFHAGQTWFQKRYVNLWWVLPYRMLTVPQDCLTSEHNMSKRMGQTGVFRSGFYLSPVQSLDLVGWKGTVGIGCVTTISVFISPGESAGARNLNKPPPFRPSTNTPISLLRFTQDGLSTLVLANARARLLLFSSMAKWKLKRMLRRITRRSGFSLWTLLSTKVVSALLFSKGSVYQGELRIATVHLTLLNTEPAKWESFLLSANLLPLPKSQSKEQPISVSFH